MQVTFACDLILSLSVITSDEIGEQSFGYTGLIFFAHEYLCQILKK